MKPTIQNSIGTHNSESRRRRADWRASLRSLALTLLLGIAAVLPRGVAGAEEFPPASESRIQFAGRAFGTTYSAIVLLRAGSDGAADLQAQVERLLAEIDGQMSLWREDSELSRFNRYGGTEWFDVSEETARIVAAAVDLSHATGGAFDPTVAPLVQLWNFGPRRERIRIPTEREISDARESVGAPMIEVRLSPPALRKQRPGVQVDLNAIAKGDAVDRVIGLVKQLDPVGTMVEIGGEVRTSGTKEDGSPWKIGIEQPIAEERHIQSVIELNDAALATSGDYRNFVEADGRRFSHTIDPRTGRPIEHALASVSVVADDCLTADAWATALMVLGADEGFALAEAQGIHALFLTRSNGGVLTRTTSGFPTLRPVAADATPLGGSCGSLSTFLLTVLVFGLAVAGMAVGVILSNHRLRGTCGGMSGLKDEHGNPLCDACSHPASDCEDFREMVSRESADPHGEDRP